MFVCSDVFKRSLSTVERLICPIEGFPVSYRWERGMEQSGSSSASGSGSSSSGRNELVFTPVSIGRVLHCKTLLFCDGEGYSRFFQQLLATLYAKSGDLSLQQMFSLPTTDCTPVLPHITHSPAGGPW